MLTLLRRVACYEIKLYASNFSHRSTCVVGINDIVDRTYRGCPQGCICGPLIRNIMMDPLIKQLEGICG